MRLNIKEYGSDLVTIFTCYQSWTFVVCGNLWFDSRIEWKKLREKSNFTTFQLQLHKVFMIWVFEHTNVSFGTFVIMLIMIQTKSLHWESRQSALKFRSQMCKFVHERTKGFRWIFIDAERHDHFHRCSLIILSHYSIPMSISGYVGYKEGLDLALLGKCIHHPSVTSHYTL